MLLSEFAPLISTATEIIALGIFVVTAVVILGRLLNSVAGEFLLEIPLLLLICLISYAIFGLIGVGLKLSPNQVTRVADVGLVIGVVAAAGWGASSGRKNGTSEPGKRRGAWFFLCLWLGFCFASWVGHAAGGWLGLLTITAPAVLGFWLLLHYLARFILPLDETQSVSEALRCLLTFSAGTNYPYFAIEDREKVERVPGNQFKQDPLRGTTIYGPGIFLTGPDHVVVVSSGLGDTSIRGPGVAFTYLFEATQEPMELRLQQRLYTVEAFTKDGIKVKFNAFGPFQLDAGKQQPEEGKPFPVHAKSVFKAYHYAQLVDIQRGKRNGEIVEERKKRRWDELYEIKGTHVMQEIIADHTFDELCEPHDLEKDPRTKIAKEYRKRMRQELPEYGIKIPGGGVSNLFPADKDAVFEQRIKSWQAHWQRKFLERLGAAEAEVEHLIGQARAQVQAEMIQNISNAIAEAATNDAEVIVNTVVLRFIESLNQMVARSQLRERLPASVVSAVDDWPRIIGGE
jgi:hypothetical protein